MRNVINLDAFRSKGDGLDRLTNDDVVDVALLAHWRLSEPGEVLSGTVTRQRMREALSEARDYIRADDGRSIA